MATSLRDRGVVRTAQSVLDVVEDWRFDRWNGVETRGECDLDGLGLAGGNRAFAVGYRPVRSGHIKRVLRRLPIVPTGWTFVDLGCGKGRVLVASSLEGFGRSVGVELAAELCGLAAQNRDAFERRRRRRSGIEIVHGDAADVRFDPVPTVFYAYNPFGPEVMARVVANIECSWLGHAAPRWFCYTNPRCSELIDGLPGATLIDEVVWGGERTRIWRLA